MLARASVTASMGWPKKKSNPFSERAKELNAQIASLEAEIKKLDAKMADTPAHPRLRPAVVPSGDRSPHQPVVVEPHPPALKPTEPVFEEIGSHRLKTGTDNSVTPEYYNEFGVRKYDLTALVRRIRNFFSGPSASNPKLVSYLAAGGIQGLRPMRYERRVARNRFIFLTICLFLALLGTFWMFMRSR